MRRAQRLGWIALPWFVCLWVYWYGLKAWFLQDDFAWLGLHLSIFNFHDLLDALFAPKAQGTIRPLSERGYFLVLQQIFGYEALPFRIVAFATAFADMALLSALTWRWTKSRLAGMLAAIFWIVNSSLATPMSWSSSYNELLCIFFLLVSIYLLQRYAETGRTGYYAAQYVTFLLGFGALELNVVYPALALLFAMCCARRIVWKTVPLFAISALYTLIHNHYSPKATSGVYGMYWDRRILSTFGKYVVWAMGPARLKLVGWNHPRIETYATAALIVALLWFAVCKIRRGNLLPVVMIGWFVIVLSPVLPLREHITDYYVVIPLAGLAMLGGWASAEAALDGWAARTTAVVMSGIYVLSAVPVDRAVLRWQYDRSIAARDLFYGVEAAHQLHPTSIILLKGVSDDLFWSMVSNSPFRLLGITEIYMTPDAESNITPHPEIGTVQDFVLPPAVMMKALDAGRAVVYEVGNGPLRNITGVYARIAPKMFKAELPRQVDAGQTLFNDQLGSTWYPAESGFRWMPQTATVKLGGPQNAAQKLYLSGVLPEQLVERDPVHVTVSVDGQRVETFTLGRRNTSFEVSAPLPASTLNKEEIQVTIASDRTYTPPSDPRPLSIAFGKIAIR